MSPYLCSKHFTTELSPQVLGLRFLISCPKDNKYGIFTSILMNGREGAPKNMRRIWHTAGSGHGKGHHRPRHMGGFFKIKKAKE